MAGPWRFGSSAAGYIDLPGVQSDIPVGYLEAGGSARSLDNTLLVDRTGSVKRSWQTAFRPWADATLWRPFERMYLASRGPYEMYDPTVANMLPIDDRLGVGWVTSTGTAVTSGSDMRLALSSSPASAQTAISSSPAAANLCAVTAGVAYVAAITVDVAFSGSLSVYGYGATPSGSGTIQGSASSWTTAGRYSVAFTAGAGIAYVALRVVRTAGSGKVVDPSLVADTVAGDKNLRSVCVMSVAPVANQMQDNSQTPNAASWSVTLEEV